MSDVTKPVILDETGQMVNQKLAPIPDGLQAIRDAIDRLDIIWYVEKDSVSE